MSDNRLTDFEKASAAERADTVVVEFWNFLRTTKKWWLLPILVLVLLFGVIMVFSGTAAAPFIYTLF